MKLYDVIVADKKDAPDERTLNLSPEGRKPTRPAHSLRRHIIVYGIFFLLIAGMYALGIVFVHAKVTIYERQVPFDVDNTSIDLEYESAETPERLAYQTMVVRDTLTREIFGSQVVVSDTKAKGQVIFFNEYSSASQTIGSGTTLVTSDGKKYVTTEKATVPGYATDKTTKTKQPGTSKPVGIVAAAAGSDYNTSGTSFSVSSFSGTKKTQLYARSSSSITGGDSGGKHTVTDAEKDSAVSLLTSQLEEKLKRETRPQVPEGYITYPDLQVFLPDQNSLILQGPDIKFPASLSGSLITYLIPDVQFEQAIARIALGERTFPRVAIPDIENLSVEPSSALPSGAADFPQTVTLSVSGKGTIIAKADQDALRGSLVGIRRSQFSGVLSNVPEIDHATYSLIPFWASFFPSKSSRITIVVR